MIKKSYYHPIGRGKGGPGMDLSQLRVFYHVAKLKSFAAAADALFVTPPAVSIKIKQLESHYDLKLFERSGRKVELTDPGKPCSAMPSGSSTS